MPPSVTSRSLLRLSVMPAVILLLPWLVFLPSLDGAFVFDDISGVVENEGVHNLDHVADMVQFWVPSDVSYRPLRYFSYAVDWVRGNGAPRAFHQTNFLLHGLGGLALWQLLLIVLPDRRLAAWATLLWLVHPLQVEAVAYVSGRKDLLATLFYFLALIGAMVRARSGNPVSRTLGALTFALAASLSFLAKESSLTLPMTALVLDAVVAREGNLRTRVGAALRGGRVFYGAIAVAGGAALFYKLVLAPGTKIPFDVLTAPFTNLPDALRSYSLYLRKTLWPWPLVADLNGLFPVNQGQTNGWGSFWNGGTWPATTLGLGCGALLLAAARGTRWNRLVPAALGLYLLTALPVANLIPLNEPAAEHYAHLPLAALAVGLVAAVAALAGRLKVPRRIGLALAVPALIGLAVNSHIRSRVWESPAALWTSVIAVHGGSDRAWSNLGLVHLESGNEDAALVAFRRGLAVGQSSQPRIVANFMQALSRRGDKQEAINAGRRGLTARPDDPLLLSLTGNLLLAEGQAEAARSLLDHLASLPAGDLTAVAGWRRDRGVAHALTGDVGTGEKLLREALALDATDAAAWSSLGWLLLNQNRLAEADTVLGRAVALPDASGVAWRNRAVVLLRQGRAEAAARALDVAAQRGATIPSSLREAVAGAAR